MAQRRMIDKKISVSEQVANLEPTAQLLFTWLIIHADDAGLLPRSAKTIKALVIPMLDVNWEDVDNMMETIAGQGLTEEFQYGSTTYWHIKNFKQYQLLRKDRQPQTILPIQLLDKPTDSWSLLENIVDNHLDVSGVSATWQCHAELEEIRLDELEEVDKEEEINSDFSEKNQNQNKSGYEKAREMAASLKGAN